MAPAASASASASKPKLLPHQLVARGVRSSYIQRVQTLAGPGAYAIPSSFQQTPLNDKLREVQQQYGREFARRQRLQSDGARLEQDTFAGVKSDGADEAKQQRSAALDKYRARRDHLRAMLLQMHPHERWHHELGSPDSSRAMALSADAAPPSMSPSPSCYDAYVDGYRHQRAASTSTSVACAPVAPLDLRFAPSSPSNASSYSELEEIELSIDDGLSCAASSPLPFARQQRAQLQLELLPSPSTQATSALAPLSYQQFLSTTSYAKRLQQRQQQKKKSSRSSS